MCEPSTPAPILEHCPMVERKHLKKEVAPTNETMATTESIPTDAVNETKLDWNQCQKLAQQHCLCGWATCRQREPGYNASLCCAAGYELQCCDSDSERTVVNPLQCRVAHHIKFGQDILVEYSTTGCDASSHFCYMAHCYKIFFPFIFLGEMFSKL
uniref:AWS domain-containing protein n=1 Tax=Globodera pallida TaxID=36090 RepID=A0A183CKM6_GLOPA